MIKSVTFLSVLFRGTFSCAVSTPVHVWGWDASFKSHCNQIVINHILIETTSNHQYWISKYHRAPCMCDWDKPRTTETKRI